MVVSSFLLGEIIQNREATGRIAKWSIELMGEALTYAPHKAIKSQALANFIPEWTNTQLPLPRSRQNSRQFTSTGHSCRRGLGQACYSSHLSAST